MGKRLESFTEIKEKNIENLQKINQIDVEYLKGQTVSDTTARILVILWKYNKLAGIKNLEDLNVTIKDSDVSLNALYPSNIAIRLDKIPEILYNKVLNPTIGVEMQKEILQIVIQINYITVIANKQDLNNFLQCYNTPELKECIFTLIERSQIQFSKKECIDLLSDYFSNFNNQLIWEVINEEQRKPITERKRINPTKSMNLFN